MQIYRKKVDFDKKKVELSLAILQIIIILAKSISENNKYIKMLIDFAIIKVDMFK